MSHKHRLVAAATKAAMPKLTIPPAAPLDGLRVVLGPAGGLIALTTHGLEVPVELSLAGLNKLHEMLVEQQRVKTVPPLDRGLTPAYILAEWTRLPGEGNGKVRHEDVPKALRSARRAYNLEDLL